MTPRAPNASSACNTCKKKTASDDLLPCSACDAFVHFACLFKSKKTAVVNDIIKSPYFNYRCALCLSTQSDEAAEKIPAHALSKALTQLETLTSAFSGLLDSKKPSPSSYAAAASQGLRPPGPTGLAAALLSAQQAKDEEDKRLRSAVISGLSEIPGINDIERVLGCFEACGIGKGIEVQECYRMGSAPPPQPSSPRHPASSSASNFPRKIKLVLKSPQMLATVLSRPLRNFLRDPARCSEGFTDVYFNPSRTHAERKYLALLRTRRNLLNADLLDRDDQWFIDTNRSVLVKRNEGEPDWRGPGDSGLVEWMELEEDKPEPRARQSRSGPRSSQVSQSGNH